MPSWRLVVISGSDASLNSLRVRYNISASRVYATSSWADNVTNRYYSHFSQTSSATIWTFNHNLGYRYPVITVYNTQSMVVVPQEISASSTNQVKIYFPTAIGGWASATVGSILPTTSTTSASYAAFAQNSKFSISSSYTATASYYSGLFSRGGTIADLVNGITTTGSYNVWRAPYKCRVVSLYGRAVGSTTAQVNARRSGSGGYARHTGSNLILSTANQWRTSNTVTNTDYAIGESLEIVITGSSAKQVAVQIDFRRI